MKPTRPEHIGALQLIPDVPGPIARCRSLPRQLTDSASGSRPNLPEPASFDSDLGRCLTKPTCAWMWELAEIEQIRIVPRVVWCLVKHVIPETPSNQPTRITRSSRNQWRPPDQRGLRSPSEQHTRHRPPPVPPADAAPRRHGGHHRDSAEPNVSRVRRRHPPGAGQEACLQPLRVPVLRTWAEIACPNGPAGAYPPFSSGMPTGILCAPGTA